MGNQIIVYRYEYILRWDAYNDRCIVKASDFYYIASAGCEEHSSYIIFGYVKNEEWSMIIGDDTR